MNQNQNQNVIAVINHQRRPGGWGGGPGGLAPPPPPQAPEVHFFLLIGDLKQSEVGVLFYFNLLWLLSKIENALKEVTSLTHPFQNTCFSLHKL